MIKTAVLWELLGRRWMSVQDSIRLCGVAALSQAITRWEREKGIAFERKWMNEGGSRFLAYRRAK